MSPQRPTFATAVFVAAVGLAAALPAASDGRRPNHLLGQTSPYLQEHIDNPVDWYPWGDEAIGRAKREQKPIFLSIGYSACHWCHVMAREAFSDEEIARILNEKFVAIKVDREERPDLDAIYMTAVVAMTGSGGWPMSVFLTPDLKPFYGGTYFPKQEFRARLLAIASAWESHRLEALAAADGVRDLIERQQRPATQEPRPARGGGSSPSGSARALFAAAFDKENGGFGGRPKFPPHGALRLLLQESGAPGSDKSAGGDLAALAMVTKTLDAMARGGIYDQIGGGFHRYATDERWLVPHFEKMLYDNALLVPVYLEAWARTGREEFRRVAEETLAWASREMVLPGGGFSASLDADSEGEEGRFYLWTPDEARAAIGSESADPVLAYYGLLETARFEGGRVLPHRPIPLEEFARQRGIAPAAARARIEAARRKLFEARSRRVPPHRDEKILTAWNGLMISAFALAAKATGDERDRAAAAKAARFILDNAIGPDGGPRASWTGGRAGPPGTLDDSAFLARGLLDLYDATSDRAFLDQAARIVRDAARFFDPEGGGYFLTAADQKNLIVRTKSLEDGALPSGNAAMVECLARLSRALDDPSLLDEARRTLALASPSLQASPLAAPYMILAERLARQAEEGRRAPSAARAVAATPRQALAAAAGQALAAEVAPQGSAPAAPGERIVRGAIVGRANPQRVVESSIIAPAGPVRPAQAVTLSLRLDIRPGWHVNSSRPTLEYLIPTRVEFTDPAAAILEDVAYPEGRMVSLKFAREKLSVYLGDTTIRATISPPGDSAAGPRLVPARLTYQACSDQACLAPETVEFRIPIEVGGEPVARTPRRFTGEATAGSAGDGVGAGAGGASAGSTGRLSALLGSGGKGGEGVKALLEERGLLVLLGVVFLAGLALNLTPCVYPMMPVTIGFFVNQASGSWGRRVGLPALYVLGMAVTYSVLGVAAGLTGSLFGSLLQRPWITALLVLIFLVMALSMFGLFEIRMPGWLTRFSGGRQGAVGAFLMGLTMGVAAAPCIGPFIVPLLAFVGASGKPVLGFWLFFVMAIGMGLPNLVLGTFSGALTGLPRSGTWLIYVKKVMGVALLAVALYFLQPFLPDRRLGFIVLVFALASGIYLAILEGTRMAARWFRPLKLAVGLLVIATGAWVALPMVSARPEGEWKPYSAEALENARAEGRPVIIDFFASWCLPCKELDRHTFTDPRVVGESGRFLLLKADLTSFESPPVRELRERFNVVGVPTVILIDGRGSERKELRIYGFEDAASFLSRLRQIR